MAQPLTISFLGGLGEIGRNCAAIETEGRIVLLDCGRMFAGEDLPGVESVLPDFDWLIANGDRIDACIATHAHEDHIGALVYLLAHVSFPIYGSPFTLGLIEHKLREADLLDRTDLRPIRDGDRRAIGRLDCEFLPVTHSIPSGNITAFHTAQGVILHSSDFKLDLTPVDGRRTDLSRIGALAHDPGIRLLLADSTNADIEGTTRSESDIGAELAALIRAQHGRRVIAATFASHIHRIQQLADAAVQSGRILFTLGLAMRRNVRLARELSLLRIADAAIRDISDLDDVADERALIVCTGSQGEPRAALSTMADGVNKWVEVGDNDSVILSAHPIPGNEAAVAAVRNRLARRGARVLHTGQADIHTSGHGKRQELRSLHSLAVPEWFVPVHGEYAHLTAHAELAQEMGMEPQRVLLCTDGDRIRLSDSGIERLARLQATPLYVDGTVGDIGATVISERQALRDAGFVAVVVDVDLARGRIAAGPEVTSRGWVEPPANADRHEEVAEAVRASLSAALAEGDTDPQRLSRIVRRAAGRTVDELTRRRPLIVPLIRTR